VSDAPHLPPPAGRGPALVTRPRVTALLAPAWQRRVTLVTAGAGYGKTTAIAQVAADGLASWVRVRPADAQAESLSARIAAGLGEAPARDRSVIAAATGSDDRIVLAERRAALLCELAESGQGDLLLVIDGLEQLGGDEAASHLLRVLALEAPARLHLVLSGRSLPDLASAAPRAVANYWRSPRPT
jgi:LuxR family maltose regulon positive regulatory protein